MVEITYPLLTERLVLRRFVAADLPAYYDHQRLPETVRYLLCEPRSYTECMTRVGMFADSKFEKEGDWATFAIQLKDNSELLGQIALKWGSGGGESARQLVGELGWSLAPGAQGHGYATEAAAAVLELAVRTLGFHRLEARLDVRNDASAAVCERLGMQREGVLRDNMYLKGEWTSEAIYAVVRD